MSKAVVVSATEFKAKCLSLIDEIEQDGISITVTRRGHPVAILGPAPKNAWTSPRDNWADKARIAGDIVNNVALDSWDVSR